MAGVGRLSCGWSFTVWVAPENLLAKVRTSRTYCFNPDSQGSQMVSCFSLPLPRQALRIVQVSASHSSVAATLRFLVAASEIVVSSWRLIVDRLS